MSTQELKDFVGDHFEMLNNLAFCKKCLTGAFLGMAVGGYWTQEKRDELLKDLNHARSGCAEKGTAELKSERNRGETTCHNTNIRLN